MQNSLAPEGVASINDQDTEKRNALLRRIKSLTGRNILGVRCKMPESKGGIILTQARQHKGSFERGRKGDWCEVLMVGPNCRELTPEIFNRLRKTNRVFMMFPVDGNGRHFIDCGGITIINESLMDKQPDRKKPPLPGWVFLRERNA